MMWSTFSIAFLLILLPLSGASLVYRTSTGREVTIPVYSDLMAPAHFDMHNLTVVDLTRDVSVFDYCDLSKYNPLDIQPLLQAHGIVNDDSKNDGNYTKWIAYYRAWDFSAECFHVKYWSWEYALYYTWPSLFVHHIQNGGAEGYLNTIRYREI